MVHSGMQTISGTQSQSAANTPGTGTSAPGCLGISLFAAKMVPSLLTSASWRIQRTSTSQKLAGREIIALSAGGNYSNRKLTPSTVLDIPTDGNGCALSATKNS